MNNDDFGRELNVDPAQLAEAACDADAIKQWGSGLERMLARNTYPAQVRDLIESIGAKLSRLEKLIDELDSRH